MQFACLQRGLGRQRNCICFSRTESGCFAILRGCYYLLLNLRGNFLTCVSQPWISSITMSSMVYALFLLFSTLSFSTSKQQPNYSTDNCGRRWMVRSWMVPRGWKILSSFSRILSSGDVCIVFHICPKSWRARPKKFYTASWGTVQPAQLSQQKMTTKRYFQCSSSKADFQDRKNVFWKETFYDLNKLSWSAFWFFHLVLINL